MKHILIILCLLNALYGYAQFLGGTNDGYAYASVFGTQLNGAIVSYAIMYRAGNGDGFSRSQSVQILSGGNMSTMFNGKQGDGFSSQISAPTVLTGVNLSMLYKGSEGDGYAMDFLTEVLLQGDKIILYEGGIGDGYATLISTGNFLDGLMLTLFNGGDGDGFAMDTATSKLTLELIDALVRMNVLLHPNPASHIVHIKPSDGVSITSIELYDVSGKKVNMKLSHDNTLNVSNLSDGIYLLNLFSENGTVTKKLIIKKN